MSEDSFRNVQVNYYEQAIVKDVQSVAELTTNEGENASTRQYYLEIQYIRKEISKFLFLVICRLTTNEFS